jgi:hypothetical protein
MDQTTRSHLQRATQDLRRILEAEFAAQLEGTYDILPDGRILAEHGAHLDDRQQLVRREIVEAIAHIHVKVAKKTTSHAVEDYLWEAAFTALNRFVALKMLEARGLAQQCVSKGEQSSGFKEFIGLAPGLADLPDKGYRLYLECLFDELGTEVRVLFDRRDPGSLLWPRRQTLLDLVEILNRSELEGVWGQDETIGWVYQYFNSDADRQKARYDETGKPKAPQNSYELAVRNQFFTPRYVVEFLTDNTLGRTWYEMRQGETKFKERCRYLVRRQTDVSTFGDENSPDTSNYQGPLPQDDIRKQPVYIPFRIKKDPRDLKVLDPACGSGHFLLYAFDLLIEIYLEAWGDESSPDSGATGKTLREDFPTLGALHSAIPGLILRHNLHGIDIDPRCAQIAALALWMRAQRAFTELGVIREQRPAIRRTNIVVAEPMPGEREMLDGFLRSLREDRLETLIRTALEIPETKRVRATKAMADSLCHLVRTAWEKMRLAGDAGSLLKIEEELATEIDKGRQEWEEKMPLFRVTEYAIDNANSEKYYRQLPGVERDFWDRAEALTIRAIEEYAADSQNGDQFRRAMFAEDATRGFAFIDLCRQRYDVALMNPPFGDASLPSKPYLDCTYGDTRGDVYKAFVECFQARLVPAGYLGIISSRTGFFLGPSEDWRTRVVLRLYRPITLADLGGGVLDATVDVAAYVLRNLSEAEARALTLSLVPVLEKVALDRQERFTLPKWQAARDALKRHQAVAELQHLEAAGFIQRCRGEIVRYTPHWRSVRAVSAPPDQQFPELVCVRVLEESDKESATLEAIRNPSDPRRFVCNPAGFSAVPTCPFAYWVSENVRRLFARLPSFKESGYDACVGLQTNNDEIWLRAWWEVPLGQNDVNAASRRWKPFAKGGSYSPFYTDQKLVILWGADGELIKRWKYEQLLSGNITANNSKCWNEGRYCQAGLTWPIKNRFTFKPWPLPKHSIFAQVGPSAFFDGGNVSALWALMSSSVFTYLLRVAAGWNFEVGVIQRTVVPPIDSLVAEQLSALVCNAWAHRRSLDYANQTSHAMIMPALLLMQGITLRDRCARWSTRVADVDRETAHAQRKIDSLALRLYGLTETDLAMPEATALETAESLELSESTDDETGNGSPHFEADALVKEMVDYSIGCAFGRWDIRCATVARLPPDPDPFDALPVCSPGMLQNAASLPAAPADVDADYPLRISWPGILVDDVGHGEDIDSRVNEVLAVLWPDRSEAIAQEACELIGVLTLRDYFRKPSGFFSDHLKRYSTSRRQAPIYWPLTTLGGSYTIWIYVHRFGRDTLFQALNDYVKPRLQHERQKLDRLRGAAVPQPTRTQREAIEAQGSIVSELEGLIEELVRVAPLWNPNLNDGVLINYAPLWRLIGHMPWRKHVKDCWDTLCAGAYDWSHLAMHLWPERVVPKCGQDASLAIAHGLEEIFLERDERDRLAKKAPPSGGWRPIIDRLVAERVSPAVKAALVSLQSAPAPSGRSGRGRRGNTNA